jgi:hypothetical protein
MKMTLEKQTHDCVEKNDENSVLARSDGHPSDQVKCADEQASKDKVGSPENSYVVPLPPGTPGVTCMTRQHLQGDDSTAAGVMNQTARPEAQAQGLAEKDGVKETTQGTRDKYPGGSEAAAPDAQPLLPTQMIQFLRASAGGLIPRHVIGANSENGEDSLEEQGAGGIGEVQWI